MTGFSTSARREPARAFTPEQSKALRAHYIRRVAEGLVACSTLEEQLEASIVRAEWARIGILLPLATSAPAGAITLPLRKPNTRSQRNDTSPRA